MPKTVRQIFKVNPRVKSLPKRSTLRVWVTLLLQKMGYLTIYLALLSTVQLYPSQLLLSKILGAPYKQNAMEAQILKSLT